MHHLSKPNQCTALDAVFVAYEIGHLYELLRLQKLLENDLKSFAVLVQIDSSNTHRAKILKLLANNPALLTVSYDFEGRSLSGNNPLLDATFIESEKHAVSDRSNRFRSSLGQTLPPSITEQVMRFVSSYLALIHRAECVLNVLNPRSVILAEDNLDHNTGTLIQAAHNTGRKAYITPFTIPSTEEALASISGFKDYYVQDALAEAVANAYPQWARVHQGQRILRKTPLDVLAREALRIAPPIPWMYNSGNADAIFLESDAMAELYLATGFPRSQLQVAGSAVDDVLYYGKQKRHERIVQLHSSLGINQVRPIVLCSITPDMFHQKHRVIEEFTSHDEIVCYIAAVLQKLSETYTVVFKSHPRLDAEKMRLLLEPFRVSLSMEPTERLVPLCDVYVASTSSTIRWALACGIPVVNFDMWRFDYPDFHNVPGVIEVSSKAGFEEFFERVTDHSFELTKLRELAQNDSLRWGKLDGKVRERFLAALQLPSALSLDLLI